MTPTLLVQDRPILDAIRDAVFNADDSAFLEVTREDFDIPPDAKNRQRVAILAALRACPGGCSTLELRDVLGVMSPASRVLELRRMGYKIRTVRGKSYDHAGRHHPCAFYVLEG